MEKAPIAPGQQVLDVGMGSGQLATWLAERGCAVTGTGLALESYCDVDALRARGIAAVPCGADAMPFDEGTFDVVVMSHVLEHCPNVGAALAEVRRVLKDNGWLLVFVPIQEFSVNAGHVSMGWSVGQLLYVLLTAGFRVRDGRFISWSGSIAGFVRKDSTLRLPPLRGDRGDLHILHSHGLLPRPIRSRDGFDDGFLGTIGALNWDPDHLLQLHASASRTFRIGKALTRLLPHRVRPRVIETLSMFSRAISEVHYTEPRYLGD